MSDQPARLMRVIQTDSGPVVAHVNRRGCTGDWTEADEQALAGLVRPAVAQHLARTSEPEPDNTG